MKVELRLYATLAKYLPEKPPNRFVIAEVVENTRVRDLFSRFGIPEQSVKLIFVNGVHALPEAVLFDGDRVGLFPPVGGG